MSMNDQLHRPHGSTRCPAFSPAFSLVEILIALGLFSVAVTGLLALFPVALRTEKESQEETRSTLIASGMMEALTCMKDSSSLRIAAGMNNGLPVWQTIQPQKTTNMSVAYDTSCEPIRKLSTEEAVAPIPDHQASEVATLRLISNSALPGLLTAEISIGSPASAPETGRTIRRFIRLLTTP